MFKLIGYSFAENVYGSRLIATAVILTALCMDPVCGNGQKCATTGSLGVHVCQPGSDSEANTWEKSKLCHGRDRPGGTRLALQGSGPSEGVVEAQDDAEATPQPQGRAEH